MTSSDSDGQNTPRADRVGHEALVGIARLARFHGVDGYVRRRFADTPELLPPGEQELLDGMRMSTVLRHVAVLGDLAVLREAFETASIPWAVLKGPVLAERVHGSVELRAYSDLDVLVDPERLGDALDALEQRGAIILDRNWDLVRRTMKGELHVQLPAGTMLDLHWHLLNSRRLRSAFEVPVPALLHDLRWVAVGDASVPTLQPAETIVYIAMHTMLSGAHRLVWLKDMERLFVVEDWEVGRVLETAIRWKARLLLAAAVRRVSLAIGPLLPDSVEELARLRGAERAFGALGDLAWRVVPAERESGDGSIARLVARSARSTPSASLREFGRRAGGFVRDRGGEVAATARTSMDPNDPSSILFASGGESAKRAYLRAVAEEARAT